MQKTYAALILKYWYGLEQEGDKMMAEAYVEGPIGQAQGGGKTAVKVCLGIATVSTAAACVVGGIELCLLGNRPILVEGVLVGGRMGSGGLIQIRPHNMKPWFRIDYHPVRPGGRPCPHIDINALNIKHWPWGR